MEVDLAQKEKLDSGHEASRVTLKVAGYILNFKLLKIANDVYHTFNIKKIY